MWDCWERCWDLIFERIINWIIIIVARDCSKQEFCKNFQPFRTEKCTRLIVLKIQWIRTQIQKTLAKPRKNDWGLWNQIKAHLKETWTKILIRSFTYRSY